jgi:hypothetical protein
MKMALRASTAFSLAALLTISPVMNPVAAAYAANSVQSVDVTSDSASADGGVASRGDRAADGEMTVEQSLPVDVDEAADEDFGVDASLVEPQAESTDSSFQYIYLAFTVCIVNGSALGIGRALNNRKRIIPIREINLMFSIIALQNIGY